jgi:hypothetical protein
LGTGKRSLSPSAGVTREPVGGRWRVPAAWVLSLVITGAVGLWAGGTTLAPPATIDTSPTPVLYRVVTGTVSRIQSFTAQAVWERVPAGRNSAAGIVTTVDVSAGDDVVPGQRLYSINLRPVFAAQGTVPMFRSLGKGATGTDVLQLQRLLKQLDFLVGPVSGTFTSATDQSVRAWQRKNKVDVDGIVRVGDVVFLPAVPARVAPTDRLTVGEMLSGGEPVIDTLSSAPVFTVTLSQDQAPLVPLSGAAILHAGTTSWSGDIATSATTPVGELVLTIEGASGAPLCGGECDLVPTGDVTNYRVDLVSVPETSGPLVPAAALKSKPDGSVFVVGGSGDEIAVTILAAADGRAVVAGVEPGQELRLFGRDVPAPVPSASRQP